MDEIIRKVRDLTDDQWHAFEWALGRSLSDEQQVAVRVLTPPEGEPTAAKTTPEARSAGATLPEWCDVYRGLSDNEIDAVEAVILQRADLTRERNATSPFLLDSGPCRPRLDARLARCLQ